MGPSGCEGWCFTMVTQKQKLQMPTPFHDMGSVTVGNCHHCKLLRCVYLPAESRRLARTEGATLSMWCAWRAAANKERTHSCERP